MLHTHRHDRVLALLLLAGMCAGCTTTTNFPCPGDSCARVSSPLPGTANVNGGAAVYSIPIVVPPGRADMQPSLSVDYSSRGGNGLLGMGWSFDGLSAITLCPATHIQDGYTTGVGYKPTDRLCLDGQHLAVMKGTYGEDGSIYRTFLESFVQIQLYGNLRDSSSHFVVTLKNGTKNYYKALASPLHIHTPVVWHLTLQVDPSGNTIRYVYVQPAPGEVYISEILYTGRDFNNHMQMGNRVIRFEYENRPDISIVWLAGGESRQTQLLKDIATEITRPENKISWIRKYYFDYRPSKSDGRSLLKSVTACAFDSQGLEHCQIPTAFSWSDKPPSYHQPASYAYPLDFTGARPTWNPSSTAADLPQFKIWYDYNGDGRRDLVYLGSGSSRQVHLLLTAPHGKTVDDINVNQYLEHASEFLDADGDTDLLNIGGADLLGESSGNLAFLSWQPEQLHTVQRTAIPFDPNTTIGNFTSDSSTDVLQLRRDNDGDCMLVLYKNKDSRPGHIVFSPPVTVLALRCAPASTSLQHYTLKRAGFMNSSEFPVVLIMDDNRIVWIVLFDRDTKNNLHCRAVTPEAYGISAQALTGRWYFADINGDGLQDIVYSHEDKHGLRTWWYQINTGNGYSQPVDTGVADTRSSVARSSTIVTDAYTDGKDELVYPAQLLVNFCVLTGSGKNPQKLLCSDNGLDQISPTTDLGIYRFDFVQFKANGDGRFEPVVIHNANIIGQANRLVAGDVLGNGLTQFISPFDTGFANACFAASGGQCGKCPPDFGCSLHISSTENINGDYGENAAPDILTEAITNPSTSYKWFHYPLADPVRKPYSVAPLGTDTRYLSPEDYLFTSSMYVVGEFIQYSSDNKSQTNFEYGNNAYNPSTGVEGFQWIREQSPDDNVRYTQWYYQHDPPYSGDRGASWSEFDYEPGDNLVEGKPGPHYLDYKHYTVDCQGPADNQYSIEFHCQDSHSPTFLARQRAIVEKRQQPLSYRLLSTTTTKYDYDIYGNVLYEGKEVDDQDGSRIKVTNQEYGPPDTKTWWIDRLDSTSEWVEVSKAPADPSHSAPDKNPGYSVTNSEFEYNDRRQVTLRVDHDSGAYSVATVYVYEEDPTAADFGELNEIKYIGIRNDDHAEALLDTRKFTYTPDGYFISSIADTREGTTQFKVDAQTGNILSKTNSHGKTTKFIYDVFGNQQTQ